MGFFLVIFLVIKSVFAAAYPAPIGHVNDFAHLLSPEYSKNLETQLVEFKPKSEISVVTIDSLNGDTIETYAQKLFKEWGIGDKQKDNGLLFLVSKNDRKVRIEVGYGLEPILPDGLSGEILDKYVVPDFKAGNYDSGINAGLARIQDVILKNQVYAPPTLSAKTPNNVLQYLEFAIYFIVFIGPYLVAFLARSKSVYAGGIIGAVLGFLIWKTTGAIAVGLFGLILDFILSKNYDRFKSLGLDTGFKSTYGGFWHSQGGGGSSGGFGGFGGGSSGGGGSSRSW